MAVLLDTAISSGNGNVVSPFIFVVLGLALFVGLIPFGIYFMVLWVRACRKFLKSPEKREEEAEVRKSLGEALKEARMNCNMTQEFVAEELGVSRQAVSKWETGASDPSTGNLLALAKLYGVSAEKLLKSAVKTEE